MVGKQIFLSLQAKILDVSTGAGAYGPGGPYHLFAGRDVTKSLALMDLSEESLDQPDYAPDTEDAKKSLESWKKRLLSKYTVVGELVQPLHLTLEELRSFNGRDGGRILLSLSGRIIDVTEAAATYGPGGPYNLFAGRDVTKSLALMDLREDFLDEPTYQPETEDAKKSLTSWWSRLSSKYPEVGKVTCTVSALQ